MMTFAYSIILFVFWLLLSGHFDPLLLGLGIASVGLTMFLIHRMDILDHESFPTQLMASLPGFSSYLLLEIIKSNIDVLKRILSWRSKSISPQFEELPLPQKTDLGRVIYANSITLTPGTVSVELTTDSVMVHALTKDGIDDLAEGSMAKAIPDRVVEK